MISVDSTCSTNGKDDNLLKILFRKVEEKGNIYLFICGCLIIYLCRRISNEVTKPLLLVSSCVSVRLFSCNELRTIEGMFMTVQIRVWDRQSTLRDTEFSCRD